MTINYNVQNEIQKMINEQLASFSKNSKVSVARTNSGWFSIKIGGKLYKKVESFCEVKYDLDDIEARGFNVDFARTQKF